MTTEHSLVVSSLGNKGRNSVKNTPSHQSQVKVSKRLREGYLFLLSKAKQQNPSENFSVFHSSLSIVAPKMPNQLHCLGWC